MDGCPTPDAWFALGEDPALEQHLDACAECRGVAAMIGRIGVLGAAPTASSDGEVGLVPELVPAGALLGRFVVRGAIGAGGMGVVLEAFDPKLERTVALKVVRRLRDDDAASRRARDRVLAEAKAMARLSHPNVVAIHDLIEVGDEQLIAMEHVAGPDLETWLVDQPGPRERLAVVLGLADGIAAAHAAGVVHRDIKPSNVLVANGQARVTDFGLAALAGNHTRTALGTPGYVAPEVLAGGGGDARADQYAFAVTAWRTLFDVWPAPGAPGRGRLARVLERAMAEDPAARFASMQDVVTAMRRASRVRVRAIGIGIAATVIAIGGVIAYANTRAPAAAAAACTLDTSIDAVWSADRRAAWQATTQPVYGADTPRLVGEVDRAWAAWQAAAAAACDKPTAGTQACIASLRRRLVAVLEHAPATPEASLVEDTLSFIHNTDCLAAPPPQPVTLGPADRATHDQLVSELDDVTALSWLGQYAAARAKLEAMSARAPAQDVALRGELLYRLADALARTGDTAGSLPVLQEALAIAERAGNPIARVNTMILLLSAYEELGRADEAAALAKVAEAAALAVPFDAARAGRLANVLAGIAYQAGHLDEAERKYRELVAIQEKRFAGTGGKDPEIAGALHNLGLVVHALGRIAEAKAIQERARAMFEATVGAAHPDAALPIGELAGLAHEAGDPAEAARLYREQIAIWETALGADHPNLSEPLSGLARSEAALGRHDDAVALYRRALPLATKLGAEHPLVAQTEYRLALELEGRGQRREAEPIIEHSVAAWDASGADIPDAHLARFVLARYRWAAGRRDQARTLARDAHAALAKLDARYAPDAKEIQAWLDHHR